MSIVCAAIKAGKIAISADSMSSYGALRAPYSHKANNSKLYEVNDSVIGLVGWCAIATLFEHMAKNERKLFRFGNRMEIFDTLLKLQGKMKRDYFLETDESRNQPVESNQLEGLVINANGLFEINSYREVNEYKNFWAIGSGQRYALGAMHSVFEDKTSASEIAEIGVRAAAEFDSGCSLPLDTRVLKLPAPRAAPARSRSSARSAKAGE